MSNISSFNDLLLIYNNIDQSDLLEDKINILRSWINTIEGIERSAILNFTIYKEYKQIEDFSREGINSLSVKINTNIIEEMIPLNPDIVYFQDEISTYLKEPGWNGKVLCYPVTSKEGRVIGALLLKGDNILKVYTESDLLFRFLCLKIKNIYETDYLRDKLDKENDFLSLFINKNNKEKDKVFSYRTSKLINWINLPVYISDLSGKIIYANDVFLKFLGFKNLDELLEHTSIFPVFEQRKREIELLLRYNRLDNFRLTVKNKTGLTMAIRDSALVMGTYIFGFFFDVTELVRLNRELKEALETQEFLNDKLISSSLLLQKTQITTIRSLARLAEYRDRETGDHLNRICEYSSIIVNELFKRQPYNWKITEKYVSDIVISSMLHDIGKVGIADSILLKPGKLDAKEFENMKNHTILGWAILNQADIELGEESYLTLAAAIALHHHERFDGAGYPHGLAGENIPLSARIEAIADVYDALTSKRPYKEAWSHEQAVEEIISLKNLQFDPVLIDIFIDIEDQFYQISRK